MKKKLILVALICFFSLFTLGGLFLTTPAGKVISAGMHLKKVAPKVYVDNSISEEEIKNILTDLKSSKEVVSSYFGGIQATPTVYFIQSDDNLEKYGNISGQTYNTFLGEFILFGPKGTNREIISHELVHAELRSRVDKKEIPAWFDEGLATFIDGRFQQEIDNMVIEEGEQENVYEWTTQELFRATTNKPILNRYKLAAYELTKWYEEKGNNGLALLISEYNSGHDFMSAYE